MALEKFLTYSGIGGGIEQYGRLKVTKTPYASPTALAVASICLNFLLPTTMERSRAEITNPDASDLKKLTTAAAFCAEISVISLISHLLISTQTENPALEVGMFLSCKTAANAAMISSVYLVRSYLDKIKGSPG